MLPARFTTADAFVDDIPFAVADAITEPDTFMNMADVDEIAAAAPCATTEPDTITGAVVLIPAAAEPDTSPTIKIGAVESIATDVVPPITFPFTLILVPEKRTPCISLRICPPVILPVIVNIPAVCDIPQLPPPLALEPPITLPITIVLPLLDVNASLLAIPPFCCVPPFRFPIIVMVPDDVFDIHFVVDATVLPPNPLKLLPVILKLQLPVGVSVKVACDTLGISGTLRGTLTPSKSN